MLAVSLLLVASLQDPPVERIVITGVSQQRGIEVIKDPKAAQQPLPAQDGADYLKTLPGFALIRKGGTGADPIFRGAAGSRLLVSNDSQMLLGGCNNRMDPPTSYIAPQNYDRIRVIKGPQTVLYGASNATVMFEREPVPSSDSGYLSLTTGSFGRVDVNLDNSWRTEQWFARLAASDSRSDDYRDGDGQAINSAYQRQAFDSQWGWTPNAQHTLIAAFGLGTAEASYADRSMDGTLFDRRSAALRWLANDLTPWLASLDTQLNWGSIDHVMDNYQRRTFVPSAMMPNPTARNPDRYSRSARILATLVDASSANWQLGIDYQQHQHRDRMSMNQLVQPYQDKPRVPDATFRQFGLFYEAELGWTDTVSIYHGMRFDRWQATDQRLKLGQGMQQSSNPTFGQQRRDTLFSGFVRVEQQDAGLLRYIGFGRAARFPDYWELFGNQNRSADSLSALYLDAEVLHQIDVGISQQQGDWQWDVNAFYGRTDDYLLFERNQIGQSPLVRNIESESYGAELAFRWQLHPQWLADGSLAYTHASNLSDHRPLAQQPPLELKLGAQYQTQQWTHALLWRVVDQQHRVAIGQGNLAGQDFRTSAGFATLAINSSWSAGGLWRISAGIDNVFDRTYVEHLNGAASMIAGYVPLTQINEAGRRLWFKLDYQY